MTGIINIETMDMDKIWKAAQWFSDSELVPAGDRKKPANILVKWQFGYDVGLSPSQSLTGIAVINGTPNLWGDAMLGLAMQHPEFEDIIEEFDNNLLVAKCIVKRKGQTPKVATFSKEDATVAGLWGRRSPSPWSSYPKRMLKLRARGFALRDAFPDKLRGLVSAEEAMDYSQTEKVVTPIETKAQELLDEISNKNVIENDLADNVDVNTKTISENDKISVNESANDDTVSEISIDRKHEIIQEELARQKNNVAAKHLDQARGCLDD